MSEEQLDFDSTDDAPAETETEATMVDIPVVPWFRQLSFVLRKNCLLIIRRPFLLITMVSVVVVLYFVLF